MPDQTPSRKSLLRDLTPLWLLIALIAISVPHYETVNGCGKRSEVNGDLGHRKKIVASLALG